MTESFLATSRRQLRVDVGLLLIRVGIGLYMAFAHGWGKISAGPDTWEQIGGAMSVLGITFLPTVWGFLAAMAEFVCSLLLCLGVLFRVAAFMLLFTMFVAATMHLVNGHGLAGASHAIELGVIYLGLLISGPGRISLKHHVPFLRHHWFG